MDGTGHYSFTPAHVLAERRRKAAEDEEWIQYFDGRTPTLITWDEWEDLSFWWVTNPGYYQLPSVRMIDSSNISSLLDWKMPFRIVLNKLDFRVLLVMMRLNRAFNALVREEIKRRETALMGSGFFSDKHDWFLARRCANEIYYERRMICGLWEEITTLGENKKCRRCLNGEAPGAVWSSLYSDRRIRKH
jgi:hypothetical protein